MEVKTNKKYKFCECCDKNITTQNFTTHKATKKHQINKNKYKNINLYDNINDKEIDMKYIKLELLDIRKNIDDILLKIN